MKKLFLPLLIVVAALCTQQLIAQTQINQSGISSFPYTISQPGSYILTSNITVSATGTTAISISANNVVLNLNGFSVTGPMTCNGSSCSTSNDSVGIAGWATNDTIENGSVSGFYYGVESDAGSVHDLMLTNCEWCIFANYATVYHNTVIGGNEYGMLVQLSTVTDNTVTESYGVAIQAYSTSLIGNTVTYATGTGIVGDYSSLVNNTVFDNSSWGIQLYGGTVGGNTIYNNKSGDLSLSGNAVTTKTNGCTSGAC